MAPVRRRWLFPGGLGPLASTWGTASEWAAVRVRGLIPDAASDSHAAATAPDYAFITEAILKGVTIGVDQPWACDGTGDGRVNVLDLSASRAKALDPRP